MKKLLIIVSVFALFAFCANAQQLTQVFKFEQGGAGAPAWFNGGDATRGMCVNPATGNLIVVDRDSSAGNKAYALNSSTGAEIAALDNTGISTGTHPVGKVDATSDGVIYLANLAIAGANYRIYRYANESAVPTVAYAEDGIAARMGDEIAVTGTGTGTKILVTGWQVNALQKFTTVDGLTFTKSTVTPGNPDFAFGGAVGYTSLSWDPNGTDYWATKHWDKNTSGSIYKYNGATDQSTGTPTVFRGTALCPFGSGQFKVKQIGTETIIGYGPAGDGTITGATNVYCYFYDASGTQLGYRTGALEPAAGMNANGNGTGEVDFDANARKVYILVTNNSLSGWNLPGSGESDWNLY